MRLYVLFVLFIASMMKTSVTQIFLGCLVQARQRQYTQSSAS